MSLPAGTRLGAYEIEALLGAGGMGEVYRARDTRLDRSVAIKVLPPEVASDPERRGRLQREAKAVSSLNHPHICTLHDVGEHGGTHYLVMELIHGETLAQRLARVPGGGGLPLQEALEIGHEVALALEAAHRQNIVHRDLKPANVMLTKSGVKLLDFGLAKLSARDHLAGLADPASTATSLTGAGAIVGTLSYMAPEQLEGKPIDGRTDVFAFGTLIYEVLTGTRAFEGASTASVIAAILGHQPPPVSRSQPLANPALDRLVSKCLVKNPDARWQTATDLADELHWIIASKAAAASGAATAIPAMRPATVVYVGAALLLGALLGAGMWRLWSADRTAIPAEQLVRFTIQPPITAPLNLETIWRSVTIAADGSRFAYIAGGTSSGGQLMVRNFAGPDTQALAGAPVVRDPFMSPDGQWVGFHGDGLQKIPVAGGAAVTIVNSTGTGLRGAGPGSTRGASWGDDDQIVFATSDAATGLYRVAAGGGEPVALTTPNPAADEGDHVFPSVLPGARGVLFTIKGTSDTPARIAVLDNTTGGYKVIISEASNPTYTSSGHIVYESGGSLRAVPFDLRSLSVTGESLLLVERVVITIDGASNFAVSRGGTLVFVPSRPVTPRAMVWVDRATGREVPVPGMPLRPYEAPKLSPDQTRIAVAIEDQGEDVWVWDLARSTFTQVTASPGRDSLPVWTPDGKSIVFATSRGARQGLYTKALDGIGGERRLETGRRTRPIPNAVTPDGLRVLFHASDPLASWDLMEVGLEAAGSPSDLLATPEAENFAAITADGRRIAYTSTPIGGSTPARPAIFVQAYPQAGDRRWLVANGKNLLWSRGGRELLFVDQNTLMSVSVTGDGQPMFGPPKSEIDVSRYMHGEGLREFDVSADGKRLLAVARQAVVEPPNASAQIAVTLNALADIRRNARQ